MSKSINVRWIARAVMKITSIPMTAAAAYLLFQAGGLFVLAGQSFVGASKSPYDGEDLTALAGDIGVVFGFVVLALSIFLLLLAHYMYFGTWWRPRKKVAATKQEVPAQAVIQPNVLDSKAKSRQETQ